MPASQFKLHVFPNFGVTAQYVFTGNVCGEAKDSFAQLLALVVNIFHGFSK